MPTLKGFECRVRGHDEPAYRVATTASKARADYWRYLGDCCPDLQLMDISVRRAPSHDVTFPDVPSEYANLSDRERDVILHTFGGGSHIQPDQWGTRNHYCCAPTEPLMLGLVAKGIMRGPYGVDKGGDTPGWTGAFFYLTDRGQTVARALIGVREAA